MMLKSLIAFIGGMLLAQVIDVQAVTPMLATSGSHSVALKNDGTVWAWGSDAYGQLGVGRKLQSNMPLNISALGKTVNISSGALHSLALKSDGSVWSWGGNALGQLGIGSSGLFHGTPSKVMGLPKIIKVFAGGWGSFVLADDGSVWEWGALGVGDNTSATPIKIPVTDAIQSMANGGDFSLALLQDGRLFAWGKNDKGQLGFASSQSQQIPTLISSIESIIKIVVGYDYSLALKSDGTVWAWGNNEQGQLGDGTQTDRSTPMRVFGLSDVADIATSMNLFGKHFALALKKDGTVWAWGNNQWGQLGIGSNVSQLLPVKIPSLTNVVGITAGSLHALAIRAGYTAWVWGDNSKGQIGGGDTKFSPSMLQGISNAKFVTAGVGFSLIQQTDGTVLGLGDNTSGQIGDAGELFRPYPIQVSLPGEAVFIAASGDSTIGSGTTYAVLNDGRVFGWGWGRDGNMAMGDALDRAAPIEINTLINIKAIDEGIALKNDGTVYCWGWNDRGQLGNGAVDYISHHLTTQVNGLSEIIAVSGSYGHKIALNRDGTIWAWGWNGYGQLGDGTLINQSAPKQANLFNVKAIAAGGSHSIALKEDGTVWAWGNNQYGQLGDGTKANRSIPEQILSLKNIVSVSSFSTLNSALEADGKVYIWGDGEAEPKVISELSDVVFSSVGQHHGVVIKKEGTIWSRGENNFGQLGTGTFSDVNAPQIVVNSDLSGFLDLIPEIQNNIPPDKIPPFFVIASKSGDLNATDFSLAIKGGTPPNSFSQAQFAGNYNVYVAASQPVGGTLNWWQLDSKRKLSTLPWPMEAFVQNVTLDSETDVQVEILKNEDLTNLVGSTFYVGYGTDPDEMLKNNRYRDVLTVAKP